MVFAQKFGAFSGTSCADTIAAKPEPGIEISKALREITRMAAFYLIRQPRSVASRNGGRRFRCAQTAAALGPAWILSVLGAIELLGDQSSIPGHDGVGFGDAGDLAERFASQALASLG